MPNQHYSSNNAYAKRDIDIKLILGKLNMPIMKKMLLLILMIAFGQFINAQTYSQDFHDGRIMFKLKTESQVFQKNLFLQLQQTLQKIVYLSFVHVKMRYEEGP